MAPYTSADTGNGRIQKLDSNGNYMTSWGTPGTGPGQFGNMLGGLEVDAAGDVFVADARNSRIQRFSASGALVEILGGTKGTDAGQIWQGDDLAIDASGALYVMDPSGNRWSKWIKGGRVIVTLDQ